MKSSGTLIFVGTRNGVARVQLTAAGEPSMRLGLERCDVHCVAVDPGDRDLVFAGTWDDGVHRSRDGGRTWEPVADEISERRILSLAVSRAGGGPPVVYVGTEPANLYESTDGGASWRRLAGIHAVASAPRWFYPPRAGGQRVRSIAPHVDDRALLLAGIEVGGVLRSRDGGETWEDRKRHAFEDSHALATHPLVPDRVYQAAAGGVALSTDRGESWKRVDKGLRRRFVWALAVDSADPDLWYVSAAHHPRSAHAGDGRADAAIYRKVGDGPWRATPASDGMARMPFALVALRGHPRALVAGLDDGRLLLSEDACESWQDLGVTVPRIRALAEAT